MVPLGSHLTRNSPINSNMFEKQLIIALLNQKSSSRLQVVSGGEGPFEMHQAWGEKGRPLSFWTTSVLLEEMQGFCLADAPTDLTFSAASDSNPFVSEIWAAYNVASQVDRDAFEKHLCSAVEKWLGAHGLPSLIGLLFLAAKFRIFEVVSQCGELLRRTHIARYSADVRKCVLDNVCAFLLELLSHGPARSQLLNFWKSNSCSQEEKICIATMMLKREARKFASDVIDQLFPETDQLDTRLALALELSRNLDRAVWAECIGSLQFTPDEDTFSADRFFTAMFCNRRSPYLIFADFPPDSDRRFVIVSRLCVEEYNAGKRRNYIDSEAPTIAHYEQDYLFEFDEKLNHAVSFAEGSLQRPPPLFSVIEGGKS